MVPSTLVALIVVAGAAYYMGAEYRLIQAIPEGIPTLKTEIFSGFSITALAPYIVTAFMLALLGSIDSLLTSVVADNLTKSRHNSNRELIGQGIGNGVAALFSGIPGAGATIRTVVNIQAGGKTKISGMISGILLFVILIFLGPIASNIPAAVLAGILITVGIGVMDKKGLKALPLMQWPAKIIVVTVLLLTVFWQLVYAVGVGLILASVIFFKRMSDFSARRAVISDFNKNVELGTDLPTIHKSGRKIVVERLYGPLFFGFSTQFKTTISNLPEIEILVLRMGRVPFIDQSGVNAMESAIEELHEKGIEVYITGANKQVHGLLVKLKVIPNLLPEDKVFVNYATFSKWFEETEVEADE